MNALTMVRAQAKDGGLWFDATLAPEAYLQTALRRLHAAVEKDAEVHSQCVLLADAERMCKAIGLVVATSRMAPEVNDELVAAVEQYRSHTPEQFAK